MIVYSSKDLRSRRYQPYQPHEERRGIKPGWLILGGLALLLVVCCCLSLVIALWQGWIRNPLSSSNPPPASASATKTPAPDPDKPVPMRTRAVGDNGLEVTVLNFQNPLKVEGLKSASPEQQFVLVSVRVRNTKSTGAPIPINATDFTMKGDGGITYTPNPKNITIQNLLTQATVAPGKEMTGELIFQIAVNDAGLRMFWNTGGSTRTFIVEESK
jgi:hypothetical protein